LGAFSCRRRHATTAKVPEWLNALVTAAQPRLRTAMLAALGWTALDAR
jgi:hypothetical protein